LYETGTYVRTYAIWRTLLFSSLISSLINYIYIYIGNQANQEDCGCSIVHASINGWIMSYE